MFWLWVLLGILGGLAAGVYWIVLEELTHIFSFAKGLWVIPLMTFAGLLAGLVIKKLGDPGEIDLIVDNIKMKGEDVRYRNSSLQTCEPVLPGDDPCPENPIDQCAVRGAKKLIYVYQHKSCKDARYSLNLIINITFLKCAISKQVYQSVTRISFPATSFPPSTTYRAIAYVGHVIILHFIPQMYMPA
jgi:hypothetical protein